MGHDARCGRLQNSGGILVPSPRTVPHVPDEEVAAAFASAAPALTFGARVSPCVHVAEDCAQLDHEDDFSRGGASGPSTHVSSMRRIRMPSRRLELTGSPGINTVCISVPTGRCSRVAQTNVRQPSGSLCCWRVWPPGVAGMHYKYGKMASNGKEWFRGLDTITAMRFAG